MQFATERQPFCIATSWCFTLLILFCSQILSSIYVSLNAKKSSFRCAVDVRKNGFFAAVTSHSIRILTYTSNSLLLTLMKLLIFSSPTRIQNWEDLAGYATVHHSQMYQPLNLNYRTHFQIQ